MNKDRLLINSVLVLILGVVSSTARCVQAASFLADSFANGKVTQYDATTGELIRDFIPSVPGPTGIAFGPDGDLYVASLTASQVRRYDGHSGALLGSVVDGADHGLAGPQRLTFVDGDLVVAWSNSAQLVRHSVTDGSIVQQVATGPTPVQPRLGPDFTGDGLQDIYLTSRGAGTVVRYDRNDLTAPSETYISGLNTPQEIIFLPDQDGDGIDDALVSELFGGQVVLHSSSAGSVSQFATSSVPTGLLLDENDLVYVVSAGTGIASRYQLDGTFVDDFITGLADGASIIFIPEPSSWMLLAGVGLVALDRRRRRCRCG